MSRGESVARCWDHGLWVRIGEATGQRVVTASAVVTRYRCVGNVEHLQ
jgi:hypothetical protein